MADYKANNSKANKSDQKTGTVWHTQVLKTDWWVYMLNYLYHIINVKPLSRRNCFSGMANVSVTH